ncbi:MAG TPA: PIN domain-containing protein [Candidatus Acidoferrum sp.]|nr:PIN domain-containing protein [Candidatus Acidoferrum sp.]
MILLDTGNFIALFRPEDQLNQRAAAWSLYLSEPLLVTEYVLLECVNALSRPKERPATHALIQYARSEAGCELVHASSALFEAGLRLHNERPDMEWSLTNCISFVLMKEHSVRRALAYDHHLEQAGFEALLRRDPPAE